MPGQSPRPNPTKPSATEGPAAPIDMPSLMIRCLGKSHLAMRVLDLFAQTAGHALEKLQKSLADGDLTVLAQQAHLIKGSASNVSALRVQKTAAEVEQLGKTGDRLEAQGKTAELKIEIDQCVAYIHQMQRASSPALQRKTA